MKVMDQEEGAEMEKFAKIAATGVAALMFSTSATAGLCDRYEQGYKYLTAVCSPVFVDRKPRGLCEWTSGGSVPSYPFVSNVFGFDDYKFKRGNEQFAELAKRKAGNDRGVRYVTGHCFDTRREAEAHWRKTVSDHDAVFSLHLTPYLGL